ncbi:hypothetical protein Sste5346_010367 [Sporothrix stenoceras]|uniref:VOC domain-containing protein n=1 Tax=Sporothrix stenoceras TaxID=5173 RepID=A0ABR3YG26_9PEZI
MANRADKVHLERLSYVIYEHPDPNAFLLFADDFGFELAGSSMKDNSEFFLRGYGVDPYLYIGRQAPSGEGKRFIGAGFRARTSEDFDKATKLDGAQVTDLSGMRPGAGKLVTLKDVNGYDMQIVFDQEERPHPARGVSNVTGGNPNSNGAVAKDRLGEGVFNRMGSGPAKIHKLGHFGYMTDNYKGTCDWYTSRFNFVASDVVVKPGEPDHELMSFFHVDLGKEYSDHHCFLVAGHHGSGKGTSVHHSSFEVEDLDTQMMGHKWLEEKGYKLMWGVGRHIMGSQIFDYWWDPSGFIVEHYADGDVVNEDIPTVRSAGTAAAIWGPPMPTKWD